MSNPISVEPSNVSAATIPLTAAVAILSGQTIAIDPTTGNAIVQDSLAFPSSHCIGLAINSAKPGQVVYVQVFGVVRVPRNSGGAIAIGNLVGSTSGILIDLGANGGGIDLIGICLAQDAKTTTIFVCPRLAIGGVMAPTVAAGVPSAAILTPSGQLDLEVNSAGGVTTASIQLLSTGELDLVAATGASGIDMLPSGEIDITATVLKLNGTPLGGGVPNFADSETPATFNTNSDYDILRAPNPLLSLQVFINSEAVPKPGQDRLLVQGVDYSLTTGAHGPNTRIHYLVAPTATNTIRCWYRY